MAGWELVKGRSNSTTFAPMGEDEVSIVESKQRNKVALRVNAHRKSFPKDTRSVMVYIDKERSRIGFFVVKPEQAFDAKKLSDYGKNSANVYISMPKVIAEMGFTKGRYKITRKEGTEGLIFMISLKNKIDKPVESTETKSETKEKE